MGKRLADLLDVGIGDYVILLVRDKNNTFNTIDAEISGLVHTINPNINNFLVYLPLDIARKLWQWARVSKVVVRLESKEQAPQAADRLQESSRAYQVTWRYTNGMMWMLSPLLNMQRLRIKSFLASSW